MLYYSMYYIIMKRFSLNSVNLYSTQIRFWKILTGDPQYNCWNIFGVSKLKNKIIYIIIFMLLDNSCIDIE